MDVLLWLAILSAIWWLWRRIFMPPLPPPVNGSEQQIASRPAPALPMQAPQVRPRYYPPGAVPVVPLELPEAPPEQIALTAPVGRCAICESHHPPRFNTPRIAICQRCIRLLHDEAPIDVIALNAIVGRVVAGFVFRHRDTNEDQVMRDVLAHRLLNAWISRKAIEAGFGSDVRGHRKDWLKFLRAYHFGLITGCAKEGRPRGDDWKLLARCIRHEDGNRCMRSGEHAGEKHVHHIIPLSNWGTNDPRNLVTLCYDCHRAQHPTILFSRPEPDVDGETEKCT